MGGGSNARVGRPRLSVIIPVYNSVTHLRRALDSIFEQQFAGVELLVIDGGSTDGTLDVLRAEPRIDYWLSEGDQGMYDAINKGLALCRGELTKILNADDLLTPDSFRAGWEAYLANGKVDCIVRSDIGIVDQQDRLLEVVGLVVSAGYQPPVNHPTWYVPLSVYQRNGGYLSSFRIASDYEFMWRASARGIPFVHSRQVLAHFRTGGMSAGFGNLKEGFAINRAYQGIARATYVVIVAAAKKMRSQLLLKVLGERRWQALRALSRAARLK